MPIGSMSDERYIYEKLTIQKSTIHGSGFIYHRDVNETLQPIIEGDAKKDQVISETFSDKVH